MVDAPRISRRGARILAYWVVTGLVVLLDQATKAAVRVVQPEMGVPRRIMTLIPGLFDLVHVENTGAAFSIGEGAGYFFIAVAVFAIGITFALVCTEELPMLLTVSLACVAGGGAGNMLDRVMHGSVTDFIATTFINFPVFNVADIFVTCGVALSLIGYLSWERRLEQGGAPLGE